MDSCEIELKDVLDRMIAEGMRDEALDLVFRVRDTFSEADQYIKELGVRAF